MSCGCSDAERCKAKDGRDVRCSSQTKYAICRQCKHYDDGQCKHGEPFPVRLTYDGHPCPLGVHPDPDGIVRWFGLRWYGVPYPVRLAMVYDGQIKRAKDLPGCGCIVALKQLTERWKRRAEPTV